MTNGIENHPEIHKQTEQMRFIIPRAMRFIVPRVMRFIVPRVMRFIVPRVMDLSFQE